MKKIIVFVSHDLDKVRAICDNTSWIDKGKIISTGPSKEVIDEYKDSTKNSQKAH